MSVSLLAGKRSATVNAPPVASTQSALDALRRSMGPSQSERGPAEGRSQVGDLDALFGPEASDDDKASRSAGAEAAGSAAGGGRALDPRDQVSVSRAPSGGLGGEREPCWKRPGSRLPVVMMVMLNERGELVGVPRVVQRNGAFAEAQAWRAMAGCAPYAAARAGRYRTVELDFAGDEDWIRPTGFIDIR